MNVGKVEASFEIKGLQESIKQLDQARNVLGKIDDTFTTSKTTLKNYADSWKAVNPQIAAAINNAKSARQAFGTVTEYKKSIVELAKLAKEYANTAKAAEKLKSAASVAPAVARVKTASSGVTAPQHNSRQVRDEIKAVSAALQTQQGVVSKWYNHFAKIAIGYSLAYAAIHTVKQGLVGIFNVFKDGIKTLDDIRSSGATVAGMLALLDKSEGGFTKNFTKHFTAFQTVFQRALVLLPQYSLTLEQFNAGIRELAQFGVTVNNNNLEKSIITMKTIQEIAANTSGDVKQVRQEIQALFTGASPRISDQFLRFIKTSMPDLFATFAKMRKEGKSTQEMWEVLTERLSVLGPAMQQGAKTIETQLLIMRKSISIVSAKAQETSGIYDGWLTKLMNFNKSLFTTEGGLTQFGKQIYDVFYRAWQVVDLIITSTIIIVKSVKVFGETLWKTFKSDFMQGFLTTLGSIYAIFVQILIVVGELVLKLVSLGNISGLGKLTGILLGMYSVVTITAFSWGLLIAKLKLLSGTTLIQSVITSMTALYTAFSTGGIIGLTKLVGTMALSFGVLAGQMLFAVGAGVTLGGVLVAIGTDLKNILTGVDDPLAGRRAFQNYFAELKLMAADTTKYLADIVGGTKLGDVLLPDTKDFLTKFNALMEPIKAEILKIGESSNTNLDQALLPKDTKTKKMQESAKSFVQNYYNLVEQYFSEEELTKFDFDVFAGTKTITTTNKAIADAYQKTGALVSKLGQVTNKYGELQDAEHTYEITFAIFKSSEIEAWDTILLAQQNYTAGLDKRIARESVLKDIKAQAAVGKYFDMPLNDSEMKEATELVLAEQKRISTNWEFEFAKMRLTAQSFGEYLGNSFSGLFDSIFKHEITSFGDLFIGTLKSIQDAFSNMLSDMVSKYFQKMLEMQFMDNGYNILGKLGAAMGPPAPAYTGMGSVNYTAPSTSLYKPFAAGGLVTEPVFGVGMRSGSTYSFAERGPERVLSNKETQGYGSGSAPNVINFINESGVPMTATQSAPQFDGEKYVTSIIVKQMATNPSFRSSMRG